MFQGSVQLLDVTKDDKYIICNSGMSMKMFELKTKGEVNLVHHFKGIHTSNHCLHSELYIFQDTIKCMALSNDNQYLITGSFDYSIKVFSLETKAQVHHIENAFPGTFILSLVLNFS